MEKAENTFFICAIAPSRLTMGVDRVYTTAGSACCEGTANAAFITPSTTITLFFP